jgi:hypothetical protein
MKAKLISSSITVAVFVTAFSIGASLRAITTAAAQPLGGVVTGQFQLETVDFKDRPEAKMLTRAYTILALGDHDYAGHRVEAMKHLEMAGKFLGVDLAGDLKDHERQVLSDDKMRQARRLLEHLIKAASIKDQDRVVNQLNDAVNQIDLALAVK